MFLVVVSSVVSTTASPMTAETDRWVNRLVQAYIDLLINEGKKDLATNGYKERF